MKKTLLILSACLCFFTSCQKKQELKPVNIKPITIEQDGCTIVSDPRLELLLIASNLAGFYPIGNTNSDYVSTIHTFFKNHKERYEYRRDGSPHRGHLYRRKAER